MSMNNVVLITGASSGFGALTARALARAGHTVYAGMRQTTGRNAPSGQGCMSENTRPAQNVDLHAIELDVYLQESANRTIKTIISEDGRWILHSQSRPHGFWPSRSLYSGTIGQLYDINVLGTQHVNRAVLPHFRAQGEVCAKRARSLGDRNIDNRAGAFTSGTNHFKNAGSPNDKPGAVKYDSGPHHGFADLVQKGLAATTPPDTDVTAVADAIVKVIDMPFGKRPFRYST